MRIRQGFLPTTLLVTLTAVAPLWATHAQTIGWLDRMFTFREEQRPLTQPGSGRASRPTYVMQPAYSPADHVPWSDFYSHPGLAAQDYMIGSASKVMRPAGTGMTLAGGPDIIGQRALENARLDRPGSVMIGEPGEFIVDNGGIGRGTQVGEPTNDWREDGKPRLTSRPGDYDYEVNANRGAPLAPGGQVLADTTPQMSVPLVVSPSATTTALPTREPNGAYLEYNTDGKATRYAVQRGDTLGRIAAQPEIYAEAALWPLIYSANRSTIGGSPNRLKPKMELTIPRDYTPDQAKQARKRAGRR